MDGLYYRVLYGWFYTIEINTSEESAFTAKLYSPFICAIIITLVSEQSNEMSKGPEVVSSRFQTECGILSSKIELLKN
jgi:hypothetical protein